MNKKIVLLIVVLIIFLILCGCWWYKRNKNITSDNLIIVTSNLKNNHKSKKRKQNLLNNFNKYNFNIIFNDGIKDEYLKIGYINNINRINKFIDSNYEYGILCDDDFFPIDNFVEELNKTVELLPDNWECLHLCPGFLWGRLFRDKNKIGNLNPEFDISHLQYHKSGRFFNNCDANIYTDLKGWLGGPEAVLVNKKYINKIKKNYEIHKYKYPSDAIYTKILNKNHYISRVPQLGYEEECGGTIF